MKNTNPVNQKWFLMCTILFLCIYSCVFRHNKNLDNKESVTKAQFWLTSGDQKALLQQQPDIDFGSITDTLPTIEVDSSQVFQQIDGFGFTLTGGSAMLLNKMGAEERKALLTELFSINNTGVSYLRISIGASDLSDRVFTYNDLPSGQTDPEMKKFSLDPERPDLIPVLKEIINIFPDIKILGSPWTPPVWMKTNQNSVGGSLKPEYYDAYALYLVKYIKGMADEGINIDAITVQNEPLHPGNNPSLLMLASEQAAFIKQSLGPSFQNARLKTKIIIYDHNADRIDYPLEVLNDIEARQYVDGSAFHLYGGTIGELTKVHNSHPDKNLYFTEQWVGAPSNFAGDFKWHVRELIIGATRNWCRTVLEWNLVADSQQKPFTPGGCTRCLGAITLDGNQITRNVAFYVIGQASKFVRPGSVRIGSTLPDSLPNVAFLTPDGKIAVIVLNDAEVSKTFNIRFKEHTLTSTLEGGSAATYIL